MEAPPHCCGESAISEPRASRRSTGEKDSCCPPAFSATPSASTAPPPLSLLLSVLPVGVAAAVLCCRHALWLVKCCRTVALCIPLLRKTTMSTMTSRSVLGMKLTRAVQCTLPCVTPGYWAMTEVTTSACVPCTEAYTTSPPPRPKEAKRDPDEPSELPPPSPAPAPLLSCLCRLSPANPCRVRLGGDVSFSTWPLGQLASLAVSMLCDKTCCASMVVACNAVAPPLLFAATAATMLAGTLSGATIKGTPPGENTKEPGGNEIQNV